MGRRRRKDIRVRERQKVRDECRADDTVHFREGRAKPTCLAWGLFRRAAVTDVEGFTPSARVFAHRATCAIGEDTPAASPDATRISSSELAGAVARTDVPIVGGGKKKRETVGRMLTDDGRGDSSGLWEEFPGKEKTLSAHRRDSQRNGVGWGGGGGGHLYVPAIARRD